MAAPVIYRLSINRFRGIKEVVWYPTQDINIVLGGGDVGKTTILDAIGLLLSPVNSANLSDADYFGRKVEDGFFIEAVISLPPETGIHEQAKLSWPWEWDGKDLIVPSADGDGGAGREAVYCVRARGTEDLELNYEIVQPDGSTDAFSVALRRAIGLIRLSGDDRNDRDLRLVQGSALDRLLSDRGLRARLASDLAKRGVKDELTPEARKALEDLDATFKRERLPDGLDIAMTGGQGISVAALIGLTADREGVQLPLSSWGAGTRRIASLSIAEQKQGEAPITLIDELERGLEPYRQRSLVKKLQEAKAQTFITTHSPFVIVAASEADLWYVDHVGKIGSLNSSKTARQRNMDPELFLSYLSVIAEGAAEKGFVFAFLERGLGVHPRQYGVHMSDAGGHESALELLEALADGGLRFGGFADEENGKHAERWKKLGEKLDKLLFRWTSGCLEENVFNAVHDDSLQALLKDPDDEKTGRRLRTLQERLNCQDKDFETIKTKAGANIRKLIIEAALGTVPEDKKTADKSEQKRFKSHSQDWFKTIGGGRELADKVFALGLWPKLKPELLPFCNAVRKAVGLAEIEDLPS